MTDLTKSEQKRRAELEARAQMFAKRDDRPAATNIDKLLDKSGAVSEAQDPPAAEPAPAAAPAPIEAAIVPKVEETQAPVKKTPQNVVKRAAPKAKPAEDAPWKNADARITVPFTTRFPEELHLKLLYLKNHMPNTSLQKIVQGAVNEKVAELLAQYYDGEV